MPRGVCSYSAHDTHLVEGVSEVQREGFELGILKTYNLLEMNHNMLQVQRYHSSNKFKRLLWLPYGYYGNYGYYGYYITVTMVTIVTYH